MKSAGRTTNTSPHAPTNNHEAGYIVMIPWCKLYRKTQDN